MTQSNSMYNEAERSECLAKMQAASDLFYSLATRTGNHAFIEFTGLMNEYIKVCDDAHKRGVDFMSANVHTGSHLPMASYRRDYINEKLECIYGEKL